MAWNRGHNIPIVTCRMSTKTQASILKWLTLYGEPASRAVAIRVKGLSLYTLDNKLVVLLVC